VTVEFVSADRAGSGGWPTGTRCHTSRTSSAMTCCSSASRAWGNRLLPKAAPGTESQPPQRRIGPGHARVSRPGMRGPGDHARGAGDLRSEEAAEIAIRAGRLGFSRWRVATALGISARELDRISSATQRSPPVRTVVIADGHMPALACASAHPGADRQPATGPWRARGRASDRSVGSTCFSTLPDALRARARLDQVSVEPAPAAACAGTWRSSTSRS
jgi:hypothetical protein